jgi:hypothetical protein
MYQKKSQLEHILLWPDTYIGSVEKHTQTLWVYEGGAMENRQVCYVPSLYKIFDEILVNVADNKQCDPTMDSLRVDIDIKGCCISVYNNADEIPIEVHQEEGVYVPEMIFGHLLTSSNYDDNVQKTTRGRNGYGAKLTNIWRLVLLAVNNLLVASHNLKALIHHIQMLIRASACGKDALKHLQDTGVGSRSGGGTTTTDSARMSSSMSSRRTSTRSSWILGHCRAKRIMTHILVELLLCHRLNYKLNI